MTATEAVIFKKAEGVDAKRKNGRALNLISYFLMEKHVKATKLHKLPSVGLIAQKGPYDWVEGAYYLGEHSAGELRQHQNGKSGSIALETFGKQGEKTSHVLRIQDELPVATLTVGPFTHTLVEQVYAIDQNEEEAMGLEPKSPELAVLHIPKEFKSDKRPGQKVVVEKAIFVNVPKSVQNDIGVDLGATNFLVATKIRPLVS